MTHLWPSRFEVEQQWLRVLRGELSREDAHDWAAEFLESEDLAPCDDSMVRLGTLYLHGFDLTRNPDEPNLIRHGHGGAYVKPFETIAADLAEWRANCRQYDADPTAWRERRLRAARRAAYDERNHDDGT